VKALASDTFPLDIIVSGTDQLSTGPHHHRDVERAECGGRASFSVAAHNQLLRPTPSYEDASSKDRWSS
jgi:hypothetical protein